MHENWNRFYDPATGRYLSTEPMLQDPEWSRDRAAEGLTTPAYAYATNDPVNRLDADGQMDSQAKRNGKPNPIVRALEAPLRNDLSKQCKRDYDDNLKKCLGNPRCSLPPPLPASPKPTLPDLKARDEVILLLLKQWAHDCEKGARCEYAACLAGANSGVGTTDWMTAYTRCMSAQ